LVGLPQTHIQRGRAALGGDVRRTSQGNHNAWLRRSRAGGASACCGALLRWGRCSQTRFSFTFCCSAVAALRRCVRCLSNVVTGYGARWRGKLVSEITFCLNNNSHGPVWTHSPPLAISHQNHVNSTRVRTVRLPPRLYKAHLLHDQSYDEPCQICSISRASTPCFLADRLTF
jgi:hypothetical protein